ncbi:MAG TPA: hypothetical protein VHC69_16270 [Polyangiaceae bacterium]|nr:hypothetical protein [Polyangiaceae bacterium]
MFQVMCALKIYMRRGDLKKSKSFWRRIFTKPLASHFIQQALRSGVTHASMSYGHMGFARGAKGIAMDVSEIPVDALPACVELVGPRPLLEQFVRDHEAELANTTLVMLEGVHLRPTLIEESETSSGVKVEYLQVGAAMEQEQEHAPELTSSLRPPPPAEA